MLPPFAGVKFYFFAVRYALASDKIYERLLKFIRALMGGSDVIVVRL